MIYVLFEVTIHDACQKDYLALAAGLREALEQSPGLIRSERFTSLSKEGKILSLSVWESEEAISSWRQELAHRRAQKEGRERMFRDYRITVTSSIRSYTLKDREEAPLDSRIFFDRPADA